MAGSNVCRLLVADGSRKKNEFYIPISSKSKHSNLFFSETNFLNLPTFSTGCSIPFRQTRHNMYVSIVPPDLNICAVSFSELCSAPISVKFWDVVFPIYIICTYLLSPCEFYFSNFILQLGHLNPSRKTGLRGAWNEASKRWNFFCLRSTNLPFTRYVYIDSKWLMIFVPYSLNQPSKRSK